MLNRSNKLTGPFMIQLKNKFRVIAGEDQLIDKKEFFGGSMTISSLGGIGGTHFTPIINPPEVGILGLSKPFDNLFLDGKNIVNQKLLPISLSYDHRVINGAYAARFVTDLSKQLNEINFLRESFNGT